MSGEQYAILAYVVGLGLVAAYSARLLCLHCKLSRREIRAGGREIAVGCRAEEAPPAARPEKPADVADMRPGRGTGTVERAPGRA